MFDTAYGNYKRKKKKESGGQKISSKGQLTGILTELSENRNFFPVAGINSGQTRMLAGLKFTFNSTTQFLYMESLRTKDKTRVYRPSVCPH